jgi:hypothetical protein
MKTQTRFLTLALVAAFAIAGCGDDNGNNSNDNQNPTSPTRTPTPLVATATPTTVVGSPTVTPTTATSTSADTPTPTPTSTSTAGFCEGPALTVTITSEAGSNLDTGWTGISFNQQAIREAQVTTNLDCPDLTNCTIDGSALVGTTFGAPLPLSAGGVSTCVVNEFREAITGTYNCETGCSESSVKLLTKVFLVLDANKPCPPCVGDPVPNDGVKGGACDGGKTPDAPCDVGGISDLFQNAGGAPPDAGKTSNDCLPSSKSVGELNIDLNPLTTGTASVDANVNCLGTSPAGSCYCPDQVEANACLAGSGIPAHVCSASGFCENNAPNGVCSGQTFIGCTLTNPPQADCEDVSPGAGSCIAQPVPCFGTTTSRTGTCGRENGTLAAVFCIPKTRAAAINTVAGLPGPGAALLPGRQVRRPR